MKSCQNLKTNSDELNRMLLGQTPTKLSVFVSYHHAGDRGYYDAFSKLFANNYEVIQDNSVEREIDSDDAEYVIRRIREDFITGSPCTVVLCGAETPQRKFVDWEIKAVKQTAVGNAATCETASLNLETSQPGFDFVVCHHVVGSEQTFLCEEHDSPMQASATLE